MVFMAVPSLITCTKNNFGCGPIEFQDYQSDRLCVLNGKFVIDTASEEYKAAVIYFPIQKLDELYNLL